ncbi:MAG: hypothetical protein WDW38_001235 [Sanguina aurantia]
MEEIYVVHQSLHLVIDHASRRVHGWTHLWLSVPDPTFLPSSIGLNSLGLDISTVSVNDTPAEHQLCQKRHQPRAPHQPLGPGLPAPAPEDSGSSATVKRIAQHATSEYAAALHEEVDSPELVVMIPDGAVDVRQQQQQQLLPQQPPAHSRDGLSAAVTAPSPTDAPEPTPSNPQQAVTPPSTDDHPGKRSQATAGAALKITIHFSSQTATTSVGTGAHCGAGMWHAGMFVSDTQLRRARALFPCLDSPRSCHTFEFEITVPVDHVAVCSGWLVSQTVRVTDSDGSRNGSAGGGGSGVVGGGSGGVGGRSGGVGGGSGGVGMRGSGGQGGRTSAALGTQATQARTFKYEVRRHWECACVFSPVCTHAHNDSLRAGRRDLQRRSRYLPAPVRLPSWLAPCSCCHTPPHSLTSMAISLHGDRPIQTHPTAITHFAPMGGGHERTLAAATRFLHIPAQLFAQTLAAGGEDPAEFPYRALHVVFVPGEIARAPVQACAGVILASADLLVEDSHFEAAVECKLALAGCLARQWLGALMMSPDPSESWVLEGMAAGLEDVFTTQLLGGNEVAWRPRHNSPSVKTGPAACLGHSCWRQAASTRWKAAAVIRMLQLKAGPEVFQRLVSGMVSEALRSLAAAAAVGKGGGGVVNLSGDSEARWVTTEGFLAEIQKVTGKRKPYRAFAERWVYGRGCPRLTLFWHYTTKKAKEVKLDFIQEGCQGSLEEGQAAQEIMEKQVGGVKLMPAPPPGCRTLTMLTFNQRPSSPNPPCRHPIPPPPHHRRRRHRTTISDFPISLKPGTKVKGRSARRAPGADPDGEDVKGAPARTPVLFIRMDPGQELLCRCFVFQGTGPLPSRAKGEPIAAALTRVDGKNESVLLHREGMMASFAAQLEGCKDVIAQSDAVAGLAWLAGDLEQHMQRNEGVVAALMRCVRSSSTCCRVRAEAVAALGATVSNYNTYEAVPLLSRFFQDHYYDRESHKLRSNDFSNMPLHIVLSAIPPALASIRDEEQRSPPEAFDLILPLLQHCDNFGNAFDDTHFIALLLESLGNLRVRHHVCGPDVNIAMCAAQGRQASCCSSWTGGWCVSRSVAATSMIECAALRAMTMIVTNYKIPASKQARLVEVQLGMQQLLLKYLKTGSHHTRCAAQECLLRLEAAVKQPANAQASSTAPEPKACCWSWVGP